MTTNVQIKEVDLYSRNVSTRIPFKFGGSLVSEMPVILARVYVEVDAGRPVHGFSSCGIPPSWFDKSPDKSVEQGIKDLITAAHTAGNLHLGYAADTAWNQHEKTENDLINELSAQGMNDLVRSFGSALLDNAIIDAICRAADSTFHNALKNNLFGMSDTLSQYIPQKPLDEIYYRHTIGMADVIRSSEIENPVADGLPQSLEQVIEKYAPVYFKIKMDSDFDTTRTRLQTLSDLLEERAGSYQVTIDANEQFQTMQSYSDFIRELAGVKGLGEFFKKVLWVEQPTTREDSLDDGVSDALESASRILPVILDEADGRDDTVIRAMTLGYRGISAKNCKSAFRTLHKFNHIHQTKNQNNFILSSEDLTNVPVVPLNQDLCVAAALGLPHAERNGHHYIRGFEFLSSEEGAAALQDYPGLYHQAGDLPAVRIEKGILNVSDLNNFGFGVKSLPHTDKLEKLELNAYQTIQH